jgi:hypothetical protein
MSFGAAPEYGRSSQSPTHSTLPPRLHRVRAPPARRRHSQDLTDDGGRPTRLFGAFREGRRFGLQAPAPRSRRPKAIERVAGWSDGLHHSRCAMTDAPEQKQRHLPWGSVPLDEISLEDRYADLPHRRHPLPGFLTLSAASSPPDLVALFHATSVPRLSGLQSFFHSASRCASRRPVLSCRPGLELVRTEARSEYEELRLQSLHPAEHSSPARPKSDGPLLSWPFPSSRLAGHDCGTEVLPSRASPSEGLLCTAGLRWATPQGLYSRAWRRLGEPSQPP